MIGQTLVQILARWKKRCDDGLSKIALGRERSPWNKRRLKELVLKMDLQPVPWRKKTPVHVSYPALERLGFPVRRGMRPAVWRVRLTTSPRA